MSSSWRSTLLVLLCLASAGHAESREGPAAENYGVIPQPESSPSRATYDHTRQLQSDEYSGCEIPPAVPSPVPIEPTWQATFPGSGSRMTYFLIRALTGIMTRNEDIFHELLAAQPKTMLRGWNAKARTDIVAVKTHYPVSHSAGFERVDDLFSRAIVVLRNPLHSIPSLFNQSYERIHRLPAHSVHGPQEEWLTWRDQADGVHHELQRFEAFVTYWVKKNHKNTRHKYLLVVTYEDLTNIETGPATAGRIAEFLGRQEGVNPVAPERIPCIWDAIVNYKHHAEEDPGRVVEGDERGRQLNVQASGSKVRPYSARMLDQMAGMLERLLVKFGEDEYLRMTFSKYIEEVRNTPIEEGL